METKSEKTELELLLELQKKWKKREVWKVARSWGWIILFTLALIGILKFYFSLGFNEISISVFILLGLLIFTPLSKIFPTDRKMPPRLRDLAFERLEHLSIVDAKWVGKEDELTERKRQLREIIFKPSRITKSMVEEYSRLL
ncbi:MAG: hypothetical protein LBO09_01675 [Candidatus Peribacteria bacterium]|jgi:hypothetical protein|nr:hypothetical protein [Candidatus Peribacteria bacterium]